MLELLKFKKMLLEQKQRCDAKIHDRNIKETERLYFMGKYDEIISLLEKMEEDNE